MRNIIRNMDKASRDLDERYMSIRAKETQLEIHKRALSMLYEAGLDDQIIHEQVQLHENAIRSLQGEIAPLKLEQINDFSRLEDPEVFEVMKMRYFNYLTWDEIAEKHDRTGRWAQLQRNKGLYLILLAKEETPRSL